MPKSKLIDCMTELGVEFDKDENQAIIFDTIDTNNDGAIDFDEFKAYLLQPKSLELWAASMPLAALVADSVSAVTQSKNAHDPLQVVCDLKESSIKMVQEAVSIGFGILLREQVKRLQDARVKSQAQGDSNSKYQVLEMSSGDVDDFHLGLEGRIGTIAALYLETSRANILQSFSLPNICRAFDVCVSFRCKAPAAFSCSMSVTCSTRGGDNSMSTFSEILA